ncbi:MAG: M20 family metallopeptidase [Brevefilum sp.]|nr:M20 family metallopeptidase [Brevefilum sp.]MDT8380851.1 M20 family metallopeptidase [Brevefilum sp.]MDW7755181.1 M20 family metallopeptidase [Brevefilum sp.]
MTFLDEALQIKEEIIALRRDIHSHPELGFEEKRTSKIVADRLEELGLTVTRGIAETGVVGILEGKKDSPVLLLRFDMDALPILEENDVDYASQNPGAMHACGHDSHVAIGLSVAKLLAAKRDTLQGTVKFVFQPAEEGGGGAERMVDEGVLENPMPDYSMGVHVWNDKPVGWYGLTKGPVMAGAHIFSVKLEGKGAHAASPHQGIDPVVAAAQIITALQTILSRNVPPLESAVVSVCQVDSGTAFNIIPQQANFSGTIRTFMPEVFERVKQRFISIVNDVASAFDCQAEISIKRITYPVVNDPVLVDLMANAVNNVDADAVIDFSLQTMGSEDFSFMMHDIPGCFVMIGSANSEKGLNYGHHHPKFDIDEACLPYAVAILASGAVDILEKHPKSI